MSETTLDHDDRRSDHDDITSMEEYVIAGIVILLFGLLYWFLNSGWNAGSDLEAAHSQLPNTDIAHAEGSGSAYKAAALGAAAVAASTAKAPASTPSAVKAVATEAAVKETTPDFQVKAKPAVGEAAPLSEADLANLESTEKAMKLANAELQKSEDQKPEATQPDLDTADTGKSDQPEAEKENSGKPDAQSSQKPVEDKDKADTKTPEKQPEADKAKEGVDNQSADKAKPSADNPTDPSANSSAKAETYALPDGSKVTIKPDGFENALKTAIEKGEVNKPIIFDNIFFGSGAAQINAKSDHQIRATAALLHKHPNTKILLRGHTDNTGNPASNIQLSLMRANAMGLALGRMGIDLQRIRILGVGDAAPIADNKTDAGRSKNRRIEVVITQ